MRTFSIASCLALALVACKADPPKATSERAAAGEPSSGTHAGPPVRSGKIKLPPIKARAQPALPETKPAPPEDRRGRFARWDTDGDGELSDEERAAMRDARRAERMARLDTDGDGQVSDQERAAAREARQAARIARLDTDGDGEVSDDERAAARTARTEAMHARFDRDGNGELTVDELSGTRWFRGDPAAADADHDGKISVDELQQAMGQRRFGRRRPRGGE